MFFPNYVHTYLSKIDIYRFYSIIFEKNCKSLEDKNAPSESILAHCDRVVPGGDDSYKTLMMFVRSDKSIEDYNVKLV